MDIPVVTKEFEEFEFKYYDSSKVSSSIFLPDSTYKELAKQSYGYLTQIYPPKSYFKITKKYYKNGFIQAKGVSFNYGDFKTGIWYYYDENGKLTQEENNDLSYKFSFENLLKYINYENIPLTLGYTPFGFNTTIRKDINLDKPVWVIEWLKNDNNNSDIIEEIIMDGIDGKILTKNKIDFIRE